MGKQISFLMDNMDESKFMNFILKDAEIYFEGDLQTPTKVTQLPKQFSGKGWFKVFLFKKEFGEMVYERLDKWTKSNIPEEEIIIYNRKINENISQSIESLIREGYRLTN